MHSLHLPRLAAVALALVASVAFAQPTLNVVNTTALNAEFSNAGKGAFAPQTVGLTGVAFGTGLTAGFVIGGGSTPVRVLIRVAGPGLAQFGVGGTVVDPQLALFNAQSVQIAANNDWNNVANEICHHGQPREIARRVGRYCDFYFWAAVGGRVRG